MKVCYSSLILVGVKLGNTASNECGNAVETVNITVQCKLQRCHSCHGILTIVKISVFQEEREMSLRTHEFP